MYSSFLCVIVIGLQVFQVFAEDEFNSKLWHKYLRKINENKKDQFHSQLWHQNLQKMNEENYDEFHSQLWHENLEETTEENKVQLHSELWHKNLQKINEENKKKAAYEMAVFNATNAFMNGTHPPRMQSAKTNAYLVCAEKTEISPDTILRIKKGDWKVADTKAKDWVQCVLMESDLMTDQSVFRLDVAFKDLTDSEKASLESNIDKCLPTKVMPPVEISWEFAKCFQTADPRNSLF